MKVPIIVWIVLSAVIPMVAQKPASAPVPLKPLDWNTYLDKVQGA